MEKIKSDKFYEQREQWLAHIGLTVDDISVDRFGDEYVMCYEPAMGVAESFDSLNIIYLPYRLQFNYES